MLRPYTVLKKFNVDDNGDFIAIIIIIIITVAKVDTYLPLCVCQQDN